MQTQASNHAANRNWNSGADERQRRRPYKIPCRYPSGAAVWLGGVVLILAAEASSANGTGGSLEDLEFATLASRTLGEHGDAMVDLSIVVNNFGAVCSYVILVGSLTSSVLTEWIGEEITNSVSMPLWSSFYFIAPLMVLVFVLPPCLIRHLSNLR